MRKWGQGNLYIAYILPKHLFTIKDVFGIPKSGILLSIYFVLQQQDVYRRCNIEWTDKIHRQVNFEFGLYISCPYNHTIIYRAWGYIC